MSLSLYDATVPSYLQMLTAMQGLLDKAEEHCAESHLEAADIIEARFAEDMFPFSYQIKSCAVHSLGAIEGLRKGVFSPDTTTPPDSFAGLRSRIADAVTGLESIANDELEGFVGKPMEFRMGELVIPFTGDTFLLSFSQPNFYFHATTAYDLMRWKGVPLGKRDFLGPMRIRRG